MKCIPRIAILILIFGVLTACIPTRSSKQCQTKGNTALALALLHPDLLNNNGAKAQIEVPQELTQAAAELMLIPDSGNNIMTVLGMLYENPQLDKAARGFARQAYLQCVADH